ncbi:MAG: aminodeoxychorismate/anthranilate synthase component II [Planctomycetes bacterium]|nr:aminodeoxychorismate/anthranilate synthase component II [Planctomycetota bacterium]MCL4731139.1 aminodeoxychorismate/anthranilate synthase component II [Planctomycetota bacterium]
MLLLVDNYDSFTFNLAHYLTELGQAVRVVRNDALSVEAALALGPQRLVISPGPGRPEQSGITLGLLAALAGRVPVLGVCLGLQAIGLHFGARVVPAPGVVHGRASAVRHDGHGLFAGLPSPFAAGRYHSLCLDDAGLPSCLEATAWADDGVIMAARHRDLDVTGVQFHPESVLTAHGHALLRNWLQS